MQENMKKINPTGRILDMLSDELCRAPKGFYQRKDVINLYKKVEKERNQLINILQDSQIELINKYLEDQENYILMEANEYFIQGIRCGMQLHDEINEVNLCLNVEKR